MEVLLERTEHDLRAAGAKTTIYAFRGALADGAAEENRPDVRAVAGLAGVAMGLVEIG